MSLPPGVRQPTKLKFNPVSNREYYSRMNGMLDHCRGTPGWAFNHKFDTLTTKAKATLFIVVPSFRFKNTKKPYFL